MDSPSLAWLVRSGTLGWTLCTGLVLSAGRVAALPQGERDPWRAGIVHQAARWNPLFDHRCEQYAPGDTVWSALGQDPLGRPVRMSKVLVDEGDAKGLWQLEDGRVLTRSEYLAAFSPLTPSALGAALKVRLACAEEAESLPILIELRTQPLHSLSRSLKSDQQQAIGDLAARFAGLAQVETEVETERESEGESEGGPFESAAAERLSIATEYDALTHGMRRSLARAVSEATREDRETIQRWIEAHGGQVGPGPRLMGFLSAQLGIGEIRKLSEHPLVCSVDLAGQLAGQLDVSVGSLVASAFWDNGYRGGASAFDPGLLDSGMDTGHPAFSGLVVNYNIEHYWASRASNYADSWTDPDDFHGHGTAAAGILASRGSATWTSHLGMAPGLTSRLYNLKSGFRTTSGAASVVLADAIDNIDWGIAGSAVDDIDLLNFSYGVSASGDDSPLSRFMDAVVDDLDIPVTIAAGNGGPSGTSLVDPAIAYNVISVGSMNDYGTTYRGDDVIAYSSSMGPTPGGRRKPDLIAPGSYITTTSSNWETGLDFGTWSGTSFAAPHAMGAVLLAMDYLGPPVQPTRIKAMLINSADKWGGVNWNNTYGWGYIDLQDAWSRRRETFMRNVSPKGSSGDYDLFKVTIAPWADYVTIVWNRHVDYSWGGNYPNTWYGLNDLDLMLYDHENGRLMDISSSGIDNVEQVQYIPSSPVECVVRVAAADSSFSAVSQETYAIAGPPGLEFPSKLPQLKPIISAPEWVPAGEEYPVRVILRNTGDFNAIKPTVTLALPAGHILVHGDNPRQSQTVRSDGGTPNWKRNQVFEWTVRAPSTTGGSFLRISASSQCWGETWSGAAKHLVKVK